PGPRRAARCHRGGLPATDGRSRARGADGRAPDRAPLRTLGDGRVGPERGDGPRHPGAAPARAPRRGGARHPPGSAHRPRQGRARGAGAGRPPRARVRTRLPDDLPGGAGRRPGAHHLPAEVPRGRRNPGPGRRARCASGEAPMKPTRPVTTLRRPGGLVVTAPPAEPPSAVREGFVRSGETGVPPDVWGRPGTSGETSPDVSRRPTEPRAPQGSRVVVARKHAPARRRTTVYFQVATAEALTARCQAEGRELS